VSLLLIVVALNHKQMQKALKIMFTLGWRFFYVVVKKVSNQTNNSASEKARQKTNKVKGKKIAAKLFAAIVFYTDQTGSVTNPANYNLSHKQIFGCVTAAFKNTTQSLKRFHLNLSYSLTGNTKLLTHFFQS